MECRWNSNSRQVQESNLSCAHGKTLFEKYEMIWFWFVTHDTLHICYSVTGCSVSWLEPDDWPVLNICRWIVKSESRLLWYVSQISQPSQLTFIIFVRFFVAAADPISSCNKNSTFSSQPLLALKTLNSIYFMHAQCKKRAEVRSERKF